jgi:LysM repeat protein
VWNPLRAALTVPTTIAGSLALTLSAVPAHADAQERVADAHSALGGHVGSALPAAAAAPAPAAGAAAAPAAGTYTIVRGDTISRIARAYGVSTAAVLKANGLSPSSIIYPGQRITIPGRIVTAASQAPATASTASAATSWTVRPGDTVTAIAKRFGVSVRAVLTANGLSASSIIYPGQRVAIPSPTGLTADQSANARMIIRVGRQLGVSERGIAIALGTAMQESSLRNLASGDRDSIGLFQQRPSHGWGTPAQIADAERSTRVFYGGPRDPNGRVTRGLLDIPGWQSMTFAQAAQAVQNSAYPNAYAQWEAPAARWLAALG